MDREEIEIGRFYRHHSGGLYKVTGFRRAKMNQGIWVDGVDYEALNPEFPSFWTDFERFCSRFNPEISTKDVHETIN